MEKIVTDQSSNPVKMSAKQRIILRKVKVDPVKVKALFDKGLNIWEVTEQYYGFAFEHGDRQTWLFYQKINNERKRQNLGRNVVHLEPVTAQLVKNYLKDHKPDELITLLSKKQ